MAHDIEHGPEEAVATEASSLLSPPSAEVQVAPVKPIASAHRTRCSWPWIYVVLVCIGVAVVSDVGESLYAAPKVRLFESVACTRYYLRHDPSLVDRKGSVPEHFCKIDSVQSKVASVLGWQLFFDSIPAILLPIPYGYLADSRGRKWILVLALAGYTTSWASTLFFVRILNANWSSTPCATCPNGSFLTGWSTALTLELRVVIVALLPCWRWSNYRNNPDHNRCCRCRATRAQVCAPLPNLWSNSICLTRSLPW
jgi:hypothetical protein